MKKPAANSSNRVVSYLAMAHGDYIAGRHLLRQGFLEHGAMLAATAAEKYLKAVIGVHGIDNSDHLGGTLYKLVDRCQPGLLEASDRDFLKFLEKAYRLRYASASSPGFAIVINQYRTLIAIDAFIARVDRGFAISGNGTSVQTPYRAGIAAADNRLAGENAALDPSLLPILISRNNKVLDLKVEDDCTTLRIEYETGGVNMSGPFAKIPELSTKKRSFLLSRG